MKESPFSLHWFLFGMIAVAIAFSFYKYFFAKNYTFLVEAPCDSSTQECYVRDCEEEECPPNGLSTYRIFAVPASRFGECTDNSCIDLCVEGGPCAELLCSAQEEISCERPE
ncbi:hypothetical protein A2853_00470 [Candidatus Kaiserbacteria bacterium RIFCSPHIGHO2_01_FULL_55_17]|uniref:Uncharacterized protein n=1 Tax=Candidatus Kaiserbacteria bacterium RIFCSPHIGHO2_01_FULL_55_17 TaxID=1798484 RepID=A0A1F6D9Z9_9BACT|nr:MAG: hypothetical protein A2853_00470 [Candidatus Kaiserbacteria bacterium RIFCSPHIGHO2_01_FULL_55_17]